MQLPFDHQLLKWRNRLHGRNITYEENIKRRDQKANQIRKNAHCLRGLQRPDPKNTRYAPELRVMNTIKEKQNNLYVFYLFF